MLSFIRDKLLRSDDISITSSPSPSGSNSSNEGVVNRGRSKSAGDVKPIVEDSPQYHFPCAGDIDPSSSSSYGSSSSTRFSSSSLETPPTSPSTSTSALSSAAKVVSPSTFKVGSTPGKTPSRHSIHTSSSSSPGTVNSSKDALHYRNMGGDPDNPYPCYISVDPYDSDAYWFEAVNSDRTYLTLECNWRGEIVIAKVYNQRGKDHMTSLLRVGDILISVNDHLIFNDDYNDLLAFLEMLRICDFPRKLKFLDPLKCSLELYKEKIKLINRFNRKDDASFKDDCEAATDGFGRSLNQCVYENYYVDIVSNESVDSLLRDISTSDFQKWSYSYRDLDWINYLRAIGGFKNIKSMNEFTPSPLLRQLVRKGIPSHLRPMIWKKISLCDLHRRTYESAEGASLCNDVGESDDGNIKWSQRNSISYYETLLMRCNNGALSEAIQTEIEKDICRTFPDNEYFASRSPLKSSSKNKNSSKMKMTNNNGDETTSGERALRRVLQCFAIHNPNIGYCQSINYIAAILLLVYHNGGEEDGDSGVEDNISETTKSPLMADRYAGIYADRDKDSDDDTSTASSIAPSAASSQFNTPTKRGGADHHIPASAPGKLGIPSTSEEEAFWMLVTIVETILPSDYYSSSMVGLYADIQVMTIILQKALPRLFSHLETLSCQLPILTIQWLLCIFSTSMPREPCLRIWDMLLNEGSKVIFRIALAILHYYQDSLLKCTNSGEILLCMRSCTMSLINIDELIAEAYEAYDNHYENLLTCLLESNKRNNISKSEGGTSSSSSSKGFFRSDKSRNAHISGPIARRRFLKSESERNRHERELRHQEKNRTSGIDSIKKIFGNKKSLESSNSQVNSVSTAAPPPPQKSERFIKHVEEEEVVESDNSLLFKPNYTDASGVSFDEDSVSSSTIISNVGVEVLRAKNSIMLPTSDDQPPLRILISDFSQKFGLIQSFEECHFNSPIIATISSAASSSAIAATTATNTTNDSFVGEASWDTFRKFRRSDIIYLRNKYLPDLIAQYNNK